MSLISDDMIWFDLIWFITQILLNGYIIYIISSSFQTLDIFPKCFPLFDFHDQYFE